MGAIGTILFSALSALIGLASIIQGVEAAFSLLDRWKAHRKTIPGGKRAKATPEGFTPIAVTKTSLRDALTLAGYYFALLLELFPLWQFLSVFPLWHRLSVMASYYLALTIYPTSARHAAKRGLPRPVILFPCIEFFVANLSLMVPSLLDVPWWGLVSALAHAVCFQGFGFYLLRYVVEELVLPWWDSLPDE